MTQEKWRAGFSDGTGPEYVTAGDGKTIAKTKWGCSCCEPSLSDEHTKLSSQIVREHNAHGLLIALASNFEVVEKEDGVWLFFKGNNIRGSAGVNLGSKARIVSKVALLLEEDRVAALSVAKGLTV